MSAGKANDMQHSLIDLLPTTGPFIEGHLMLVLRSYFDAGSEADSREYDVLSLAVASGTAAEWGPFERDWREMLVRHHAKYLHTTDAVARVNHYEGWTEDEADSFLRDCARIISRHFIRLRTEYDHGEFGLQLFVVSIDLKDFVSHAQSNPGTVNDANEGCFGKPFQMLSNGPVMISQPVRRFTASSIRESRSMGSW